jgi:hypothetical protein
MPDPKTNRPDLVVTNQVAGDVWLLPNVGAGFFDDRPSAVTVFQAGADPTQTLGLVTGLSEVALVNTGTRLTSTSETEASTPIGPALVAGSDVGDALSSAGVATELSSAFLMTPAEVDAMNFLNGLRPAIEHSPRLQRRDLFGEDPEAMDRPKQSPAPQLNTNDASRDLPQEIHAD